jgi:hypothetical protein
MFEEVERPSILRGMMRFMVLEFALCSAALFLAFPLMAIESFGKEPHSHFLGIGITLVIVFAMGNAISRSSPRLAPLNCWAFLFPGGLFVFGLLQEWLHPPPISSVPSELFYSSGANEGGIVIFLFTFPGVVSIGYSLGSFWAYRRSRQVSERETVDSRSLG